MDVLLPKHAYKLDTPYGDYKPYKQNEYTGHKSYIPLMLNDGPLTSYSTVFAQTYGRSYNDVIHAKLISESGSPFDVASCRSGSYRYDQSGYFKSYLDDDYRRKHTAWECHPGYTLEVGCSLVYDHEGKQAAAYAYWTLEYNYFSYTKGSVATVTTSLNRWNRDIEPYTNIVSSDPAVRRIFSDANIGIADFKSESGFSAVDLAAISSRILKAFNNSIHCFDWANMANWNYSWTGGSYSSVDAIGAKDIKDTDFLFYEDEHFIYGDWFIHHDFKSYNRTWLMQHAYFNACDSIPRLNDNSLQNVSEVASFIVNLIVRHKIVMPQKFSSAWMSYRYTFGTSTLDAEEAIQFLHRRADLSGFSDRIACYGSSNMEVDGSVVTCRCGMSLSSKRLATLKSIWDNLFILGLSPDFYVFWDSIPLSFVVDWLIPVGDMLHVVDVTKFLSNDKLHIRNVGFSLSYDKRLDGSTIHFYSRWANKPIVLDGLYWLDKESSISGKTKLFRILDGCSLILGRST